MNYCSDYDGYIIGMYVRTAWIILQIPKGLLSIYCNDYYRYTVEIIIDIL